MNCKQPGTASLHTFPLLSSTTATLLYPLEFYPPPSTHPPPTHHHIICITPVNRASYHTSQRTPHQTISHITVPSPPPSGDEDKKGGIPSDSPTALRMASLWERRLSSTTDPDIDDDDEAKPLDLFPTTRSLRQRSVTYKRPRQVSANKPPVPPPLDSNPVIMAVEEVDLDDPAFDPTSPVSSFLSSEPGSPSNVTRASSAEIVRTGKLWDEIQRLRDVVNRLDQRLALLESKNRQLLVQVETFNLSNSLDNV